MTNKSVICGQCKYKKAKHLNRDEVMQTLEDVMKDYYGYKNVIYPVFNVNKGDLTKLLADKICELRVKP